MIPIMNVTFIPKCNKKIIAITLPKTDAIPFIPHMYGMYR